jgi:hypothetical protein
MVVPDQSGKRSLADARLTAFPNQNRSCSRGEAPMEAWSVGSSVQTAVSSSSAPLALCNSDRVGKPSHEIGALATNCYGQMQTAENVGPGSRRTLLSIADTVRRLNAAREAPNLHGPSLRVHACSSMTLCEANLAALRPCRLALPIERVSFEEFSVGQHASFERLGQRATSLGKNF